MKEPIRILHVVQRMEAAGLQSFIMNIYRNIDREKVQFDFLTHYEKRDFYDDEIEKFGGNIYRLSVREDLNFIKYFKDLNRFFKLNTKYKIVHGHMNSLGLVYLYFAKKYNAPIRIAHAHNNLGGNTFKGFLKRITGKYYKKNATDLFACSREAGVAMFGESKFKVIYNAIDTKKFAYDLENRRKYRNKMGVNNKFVVGHVGRFSEPKNHIFLLEVFNEIQKIKKDSVLLLVGKGPNEDIIKNKIKKLNLEEKVMLLGNRDDVENMYQVMDVFIFPSLWEGLGIVAVEAQTSGVLTVVSKNIPSEARVTDNCYCFDLEDSPNKWAHDILDISSDFLREDKSNQVREKGYDIEIVSNELQNYFLDQEELANC